MNTNIYNKLFYYIDFRFCYSFNFVSLILLERNMPIFIYMVSFYS